MSAPTIKKVSKNGQLVLPSAYRGSHVQIFEQDGFLRLEPLFWDDDLGVWLTKEEHDDLMGEVVWSAKKDNKGEGLPLKKLNKSFDIVKKDTDG